MVNYILRPNGFTTLVAENGAAGMNLARQSAPDLIVADMRMPEMTGLELAQLVHREGLGIPVILVTAEGSEELAKLALRSGVADYIIKPFTEDELLGAVRRTLDSMHSRREHVRMQAELSAAHQALLARHKELETLTSIGRNVTAVLELDQVLAKVVEAAVSVTHAEEGSLLLLDEQTHELTMRASKNFEDSFVRTFRLRSQRLAGRLRHPHGRARPARPELAPEDQDRLPGPLPGLRAAQGARPGHRRAGRGQPPRRPRLHPPRPAPAAAPSATTLPSPSKTPTSTPAPTASAPSLRPSCARPRTGCWWWMKTTS